MAALRASAVGGEERRESSKAFCSCSPPSLHLTTHTHARTRYTHSTRITRKRDRHPRPPFARRRQNAPLVSAPVLPLLRARAHAHPLPLKQGRRRASAASRDRGTRARLKTRWRRCVVHLGRLARRNETPPPADNAHPPLFSPPKPNPPQPKTDRPRQPKALPQRLDRQARGRTPQVGHGVPRHLGERRRLHEPAVGRCRRVGRREIDRSTGGSVDQVQQRVVLEGGACGGRGGGMMRMVVVVL